MALVTAAALVLTACGGDKKDTTGPQTNTCTGTCLVVQNQSTTHTINEVYYSQCTDSDWGVNRLGSGRLRPGSTRGWEVTPGCWDFRATDNQASESWNSQSFGVQLSQGQSYFLVFSF